MDLEMFFLILGVMILVLFLMIIQLILTCIVLVKIRKGKEAHSGEEKVLPAQLEMAETPPEINPVIYPEITENITEEPEISSKSTSKPSVISALWRWFCIGSNSDGVSVEYAAATTWLMRGGILILLCAVGFFLKYSIENNLVSPTVRVILTFLAGIGMFCGGLYGLGKRFHILAAGILAAGVVTLYMGSFAGFKLYSILPAAAAFLLMVLTTVAAMVVSVRLNLLPVALIGCVGAYLTPMALSDGGGNLTFLAGYIAMISAGLLYSSREHRWRSLEAVSLLLSFGILLGGFISLDVKSHAASLVFLLMNFAVFSAIPLIRKPGSPLGLTEWLLPLGATVFTLMIGIDAVDSITPDNLATAGFSLLISASSLGEGLLLFKRRQNGFKLLPAFLCAAVFSLALAVVLADDSNCTAAAWSILAAVLVLAYTRSSQKTLLVLSFLLFAGAFLKMITEGSFGSYERFLNLGLPGAALTASGFLLLRYPQAEKFAKKLRNFYFVCGGILLFFYSTCEVEYALEPFSATVRNGGISVWWAAVAAGLLAWGIKKELKPLRISGLLLFTLCLGKVCLADIDGLNTLYKVIAFLLTGILFLGGATVYIFYRKRFSGDKK